MIMKLPISAWGAEGLGAGITFFRIFLIKQPDLTLFILHTMFAEITVHAIGTPTIVLCNHGYGHQVFAVKNHIIITGLRLHLGNLLILNGNGADKFRILLFHKSQLLIRKLQRPCHNRLRRIPGFLHFDEILTELSADISALNHTELLGHIDGQLMIHLVLTPVHLASPI